MYCWNVPEPKAVYYTKWFSDPLSLESFHSVHPGVTSSDFELLKLPIHDLHFAGYLFCILAHYS